MSIEKALLKYRLFNDECVEIRREKFLSFTNKINSELSGFHRRKVYISAPVKLTCIVTKLRIDFKVSFFWFIFGFIKGNVSVITKNQYNTLVFQLGN